MTVELTDAEKIELLSDSGFGTVEGLIAMRQEEAIESAYAVCCTLLKHEEDPREMSIREFIAIVLNDLCSTTYKGPVDITLREKP